jgi:hypothetical protein
MQDTQSPQEVIDLYRYIKEVALLKRLVVTDIAMQPWSRILKDIHVDAESIRIQYRDHLAKGEQSSLFSHYSSSKRFD